MTTQAELLDHWLTAIGQGDMQAFRKLHDATARPLLGVLTGMVGRRDVAEEILQEAFIKIWKRARTFDRARGSALAWLNTVVRHQAIDTIRARKPDEVWPETEDAFAHCIDEQANPARDAERAQARDALVRPLASLPTRMRQSVWLTCIAGHSHLESAELMDAPLGSVKSWTRRGLARLRNDAAVTADLY